MGLEPNIRAFAELVAMGWIEQDAFIALGLNRSTLSEQYNKDTLNRIVADYNFIKRHDTIKRIFDKANEDNSPSGNEESTNSIMSKEEVLTELITTINKMPRSDPRRVDVLMKYAELQQMKKDEIKEDERHVVVHMPLNCYSCNLYNIEKMKRAKKNMENEDMEMDNTAD